MAVALPSAEDMPSGYGYRPAAHQLSTIVWWAKTDAAAVFEEAANEFWGLVFGLRADGAPVATLAGPASIARKHRTVPGERYWGIELAPHAFLRGAARVTVDELRDLPTDGRFFELGGIRVPVQSPNDVERVVEVLSEQGLLAGEPVVEAALAAEPVHASERELRRAFARIAVGQKRVAMLVRARNAYRLLSEGASLTDAATGAGYADQAHMTRDFRAFAGATPGAILRGEAAPFDTRPL